jgi:hypothetical protein
VATIYISSTFTDLKDFRDAGIRALRKAGHNVVAMEDYVATGKHPPLQKCLDDVARCDYYVGIFAWRYGYIPTDGNPDQKSITELEYRKAYETCKPCFVFLLDPDVSWSPKFTDSHTEDGNSGKYIKALRQELGGDKLASFFKAPDELSSLIVAAVSQWEASTQLRQEQQYVESNELETITIELQSIESLNNALKLAQEMQKVGTFSGEQDMRFKQLKREVYEFSNLNTRLKELDKKAQALVLEIRSRLDQEGEALAQEIAKGHEHVDTKRLASHQKLDTIIQRFERELKRGRKLSQWITTHRQDWTIESVKAILKDSYKYKDLKPIKRIETDHYQEYFQVEVSQYLERIAVSLSLGRTNFLDELQGLDAFPKALYREAFEHIKTRKVQTASSLTDAEKNLLERYINHLIDHALAD